MYIWLWHYVIEATSEMKKNLLLKIKLKCDIVKCTFVTKKKNWTHAFKLYLLMFSTFVTEKWFGSRNFLNQRLKQ